MFCIKCGNEIREDAKFCPKCGHHIEMGEMPTAEKTETVEVVKEKKSGGKKPVLIILIIFLALCIGAGIFYFFFLNDGYDILGLKDVMHMVSDEDADEEDHEEDEEATPDEKSKEDGASKDETEKAEETQNTEPVEQQDANIEIRQVDNSKFPQITFYANITDQTGNSIGDLGLKDFKIQEIDAKGNVKDAELSDVSRVLNTEHINVNLVLDASGSMSDYNKMEQAKNAASAFVSQMALDKGDQVEVISFDDYVYLEQEFSNQKENILQAIGNIGIDGGTALYDGLYAGLYQTYYEDGAKCVIGFTDGMENASSYTFDDVVYLAKESGIPVFIIGIGEEYDAAELQELAAQCSGKYYSANVDDLQTILEDIYVSIYQEQQDYYVFRYQTDNLEDKSEYREIALQTSDTSAYRGSYTKPYVPETDLSGAFSTSYMNKDFILEFSDQRAITEDDLVGMSLAELRIARNELFARHGRQFRDVMLNQWFYSKTWYLDIGQKYAPDDFDSHYALSKLEAANAEVIRNYEDSIMSSRDIFPEAATVQLSAYDLALSKPVLKTALSQMQGYTSTEILKENIRLVQEAINQEDVQY